MMKRTLLLIAALSSLLLARALDLAGEEFMGKYVLVEMRGYALRDTVTSDRYGLNDQQYFNRIPVLGVVTDCGVMFPAQTYCQPWESDDSWNEYRGQQFKPELVEPLTGAIDREQFNGVCVIPSEHVGLQIDTLQPVPNLPGMIQWVGVNGKPLDTFSPTEPVTNGQLIAPPKEGAVEPAGAIYLTSHITGPGVMTLRVAGVAQLTAPGQWKLVLLRPEPAAPAAPQPEENIELQVPDKFQKGLNNLKQLLPSLKNELKKNNDI